MILKPEDLEPGMHTFKTGSDHPLYISKVDHSLAVTSGRVSLPERLDVGRQGWRQILPPLQCKPAVVYAAHCLSKSCSYMTEQHL